MKERRDHDKCAGTRLRTPTTQGQAPAPPTFRNAFLFWLKLGFISFGGPAGQIAIMHAELVEKRKWISNDRFLHALNYCMLLPGPEAQQLAIYVGWLLHRTLGGVVAGSLFVLPAVFILWALSYVYVAYGAVPWIAAIFYGLKPAVVAIVAAAVLRIGSKALKNAVMWGLAGLAFAGIYFFKTPFPVIIIGAALVGLAGHAPETGKGLRGVGRLPGPVVAAGIGDGSRVGLGAHGFQGGNLFQQSGDGHIRRSLRGAAVRFTTGS